MERSHNGSEPNEKDRSEKDKKVKQEKTRREAEQFKRKYFDYYDDIKTSVKEDW